MNTGQIIKSKTTERFTVVPNEIIKSVKLSMDEKGLLSYLLSLPSDWVLYKKNLYDSLPDSKGAIDRVFKSLQDKGFICSVKVVNEKGQFEGWNHVVYDESCLEKPKSVKVDVGLYEKPKQGFAELGESAPILNTDLILNTNSSTKTNGTFFKKSIKNQKKETRIPGAEPRPPFSSDYFKELWVNWIQYRSEKNLPSYTNNSLSKTFTQLVRDSDAKESIAVEMIETSMASNWSKIYPLQKSYAQ